MKKMVKEIVHLNMGDVAVSRLLVRTPHGPVLLEAKVSIAELEKARKAAVANGFADPRVTASEAAILSTANAITDLLENNFESVVAGEMEAYQNDPGAFGQDYFVDDEAPSIEEATLAGALLTRAKAGKPAAKRRVAVIQKDARTGRPTAVKAMRALSFAARNLAANRAPATGAKPAKKPARKVIKPLPARPMRPIVRPPSARPVIRPMPARPNLPVIRPLPAPPRPVPASIDEELLPEAPPIEAPIEEMPRPEMPDDMRPDATMYEEPEAEEPEAEEPEAEEPEAEEPEAEYEEQ